MMRVPLLLIPMMLAASAAAAPRPNPNLLPTPPILTAYPAALLFAGMDANGDARVTRAELAQAEARMFASADDDKDGSLGLIELADWARTWLGDQSAVPGRFDFDRNADDRVSRQEFAAELDRRFAAFDKDSDGVIERSELLTIVQREERGRDPSGQKATRRPGGALPDNR